jgi:hypothetical protein
MMDTIIEIMAEVLTVLAIATKEMKRGRMSKLIPCRSIDLSTQICSEKYLKKLIGNTEAEDSLQRLDKLTQEEARMASAELLKITHRVEGKVKGVDDKVEDVRSDVQDVGQKVEDVDKKVEGVDERMQAINDKVQGVDDKVQDIDDKVQDVGGKVLDVDNKLDQAIRSSSPNLTTPHSEASLSSQGISSEIIFYDGFPLQIHQSIIILHRRLVTTVQLGGSFEAVYIRTGNPLAPFCGCTENVRSSQLLLRDNS